MRDETRGTFAIDITVSRSRDAETAAREAAASVDVAATCFVLAFLPGDMDGACVARVLDEACNGVPVFGCTTAGQITESGYESSALILLSFAKAHFRCASILLSPLNPLSPPTLAATVQAHVGRFQHTAGWHRLGLIMADGLSKQEDILASILETVLSDLPVFGGSAGDAMRFEASYLLHRGKAHRDAAILLLLETDLEFRGIGVDHFLPNGAPIVITGADPDEREVFEINGAPAAQEYARLVGCDVADLSPRIFAENPLLVQHGSRHYVRAISGASSDGTLSFLAAIDDGLIMTLGQGQEIVQTLEDGLRLTNADGEPPDVILGFDCVLRKLEIEQKALARDVSRVLSAARVYGFNTYGEQYCGVHMNQTFVGVAFFGPSAGGLL